MRFCITASCITEPRILTVAKPMPVHIGCIDTAMRASDIRIQVDKGQSPRAMNTAVSLTSQCRADLGVEDGCEDRFGDSDLLCPMFQCCVSDKTWQMYERTYSLQCIVYVDSVTIIGARRPRIYGDAAKTSPVLKKYQQQTSSLLILMNVSNCLIDVVLCSATAYSLHRSSKGDKDGRIEV